MRKITENYFIFWPKLWKITKFCAKYTENYKVFFSKHIENYKDFFAKYTKNHLIFCQKYGKMQSFLAKIGKTTKFFAKNKENYGELLNFLPKNVEHYKVFC